MLPIRSASAKPSQDWPKANPLWRLLRQRAQRKDVNKEHLQNRLEQISARLTALDPARTLTLGQ